MKIKGVKMTSEEFAVKAQMKSPNIEVLGKYITRTTPLKVRCKKCNREWDMRPDAILQGHGCYECYKKEKTLTFDEINKKLRENNPTVELIGDYIDTKHHAKFKCLVCGDEWYTFPNIVISRGSKCGKCAKNHKKSENEFLSLLQTVNPHVTMIGKYTTMKSKTLFECDICEHQWSPEPSALLLGAGCPKCYHKKLGSLKRKTHENFVKEFQNKISDIEILGTYKTSKEKLEFKCKRCENIWEATPNMILRGSGCPRCNQSKGERTIEKKLQDRNIEYIPQYKFSDCKRQTYLPFDFYLPNHNICIEFDGQQHFKPVTFGSCSNEKAINEFNKTKERDAIKTQYCIDNNITLIRIPYWDFNNIDRILEQKL